MYVLFCLILIIRTELGAVSKLSKEWEERNVSVVGLSCNTLESHEKWISDINETQGTTVKFPIIADADRKIATLFDMLDCNSITTINKIKMRQTLIRKECL